MCHYQGAPLIPPNCRFLREIITEELHKPKKRRGGACKRCQAYRKESGNRNKRYKASEIQEERKNKRF